jgi:hypothetical protein
MCFLAEKLLVIKDVMVVKIMMVLMKTKMVMILKKKKKFVIMTKFVLLRMMLGYYFLLFDFVLRMIEMDAVWRLMMQDIDL